MKLKNVIFKSFDVSIESQITSVVVMAKFQGKWVFVQHKEQSSLEIPGGKREKDEPILETVKRKLREETGASEFYIVPLEVYEVQFEENIPSSFGLLCYADIKEFASLSDFEIAETHLLDGCPKNLTYPQIQSRLYERVLLKTQIIEKTRAYKHIIWDWNGTLIDDVEVAVSSVQTLLNEHNLPLVDIQRYREIFGFPIKGYYEKLGFDLSSTSFDKLCNRFHEEYNKNRLLVGKLFSDVTDHLDFFSQTKKQSILSAGAQWHLDEWVRHYNISHFFEYIFGIEDHFATSKVARGHALMKAANYSPSETILIGDTDHDVEVGKELGIDVLLVANGHQSYERLIQIHDNVIERV